jgi:opacity protein-like surface antigen
MGATDAADNQGMKRFLTVAVLTLGLLTLRAAPASADITAFLASSTTPATHGGKGVAVGIGLVIVGFEFEYAHLTEDPVNAVPGLKTGMANVLVQTPNKGMQFYVTTGGGLYNESLRGNGTTSFGTNVGGGVKIGLAGPVRLRVDYRVYHLSGSPLYPTPKRFYAGVNFSF